jgi:hypothetical protein
MQGGCSLSGFIGTWGEARLQAPLCPAGHLPPQVGRSTRGNASLHLNLLQFCAHLLVLSPLLRQRHGRRSSGSGARGPCRPKLLYVAQPLRPAGVFAPVPSVRPPSLRRANSPKGRDLGAPPSDATVAPPIPHRPSSPTIRFMTRVPDEDDAGQYEARRGGGDGKR